MKKEFTLTGIKDVVDGLEKEYRRIKRKSNKGLINAAILIQRDMDKTPPKVPADLRNLQASWFAVTIKEVATKSQFTGKDAGQLRADHSEALASAKTMLSANRPSLVMGFSANYSAAVHEYPENLNWNRPGSGPKFFEKALERNKTKILQTIGGTLKL
jgi:hypothetical protein